jgi:hypothetical protein
MNTELFVDEEKVRLIKGGEWLHRHFNNQNVTIAQSLITFCRKSRFIVRLSVVILGAVWPFQNALVYLTWPILS